MSSTRDFKSPGIFAENATTVIPPTPIQGVAYRDQVNGTDDTPNGWRYGTKVESQDWNQIMFLITSMLSTMDSQGILGWSPDVDYAVPAVTFGSDGLPYIALQPSGPSTAAQDPISSPSYWEQFASHGMVAISTTQSWPVPMSMQLGYIKPKVTVIGAGGGGGRSGTSGVGSGGGGGGGLSEMVVDLTGVSTVSVTIGAAGVGASVAGTDGGNGGNTSFGAFLTATGGTGGGGLSSTANVGGQGGLGSSGLLNTSTGSGGHSYGNEGGNGGGAGSRANQAATPGVAGLGPGGGGSGARFGQNGGNGFAGIVLIEW
jgi:hypothetical protein